MTAMCAQHLHLPPIALSAPLGLCRDPIYPSEFDRTASGSIQGGGYDYPASVVLELVG